VRGFETHRVLRSRRNPRGPAFNSTEMRSHISDAGTLSAGLLSPCSINQFVEESELGITNNTEGIDTNTLLERRLQCLQISMGGSR
jgi:hypothetical protein